MLFLANIYDPIKMKEAGVDPKLHGWEEIEASADFEAAELYAQGCNEADPDSFTSEGTVWVKAQNGTITKHRVSVDWDPTFSADLTSIGAQLSTDHSKGSDDAGI